MSWRLPLLITLITSLCWASPQVAVTSTGATATSSSTSTSSSSSSACNNAVSLCSRTYNNITHLGAHDSPFVSNSSNSYTITGNQFYTSTVQLDAGVRLLSAQVHYKNDSDTSDTTLRLCHSECDLYDAGTLVDWLSSIKTWLDSHPHEVVTLLLVNSVNADANALGQAYVSSGISTYGYSPSGATASWPTLSSMIASNKRLVTFVASLTTSATYPYLLDEFTNVFENPYDVTSPTGFNCTPDRPSSLKDNPTAALASGRLFLMNHFLYDAQAFGIETPNRDNASTTNSPDTSLTGSLGSHAALCSSTYGKAPTFVLVDWFNIGPAIETVDRLNGVTGQTTGRANTSTTIPTSARSGASYSRIGPLSFALTTALTILFLAGML